MDVLYKEVKVLPTFFSVSPEGHYQLKGVRRFQLSTYNLIHRQQVEPPRWGMLFPQHLSR